MRWEGMPREEWWGPNECSAPARGNAGTVGMSMNVYGDTEEDLARQHTLGNLASTGTKSAAVVTPAAGSFCPSLGGWRLPA